MNDRCTVSVSPELLEGLMRLEGCRLTGFSYDIDRDIWDMELRVTSKAPKAFGGEFKGAPYEPGERVEVALPEHIRDFHATFVGDVPPSNAVIMTTFVNGDSATVRCAMPKAAE